MTTLLPFPSSMGRDGRSAYAALLARAIVEGLNATEAAEIAFRQLLDLGLARPIPAHREEAAQVVMTLAASLASFGDVPSA